MSSQTRSATNRLAYIDALRGLAALMVLVFHCVLQGTGKSLAGWVQDLAAQGSRGVQLFYVLSALTLFLTLESRRARGDTSLLGFFVRRFFRIAPLFYAACIFYAWLYGPAPRYLHGRTISFNVVLANVFFVNGLNPWLLQSLVPVGWSVTVEMLFYLFVPFLFIFLTSLRRALIFACAALAASIVTFQLFQYYPLVSNQRVWKEFTFLWIGNQFPVFTLGFILFFLLKKDGILSQKLPAHKGLAFGWVCLAASFAACLALVWFAPPLFPRHFLYGIAFCLLILGLAAHPTRLVVNRFFCYCGRVSYSMYLTHVACLRLTIHLLGPIKAAKLLEPSLYALLLFVLTLALTLAVSSVTFYLIEAPGQRLGEGLWRKFLSQ